jgi:mRNA-decapping enzyme subunit 1
MPSVQRKSKKSKNSNNNNNNNAQNNETSKQAYNYQVLSFHDPKLAQIFATSSICNVYKFNVDSGEWEKLECQGTLFIYSRQLHQQQQQQQQLDSSANAKGRSGRNSANSNNSNININSESSTRADEANNDAADNKIDPYPYGLMVLNRLSLDNFSLGITPDSVATKYGLPEMEVKLEDPFIMVEASDGEMYGLWLFHEGDRPLVEGMIKWCLNAQI